jgi:hypothetical protein
MVPATILILPEVVRFCLPATILIRKLGDGSGAAAAAVEGERGRGVVKSPRKRVLSEAIAASVHPSCSFLYVECIIIEVNRDAATRSDVDRT